MPTIVRIVNSGQARKAGNLSSRVIRVVSLGSDTTPTIIRIEPRYPSEETTATPPPNGVASTALMPSPSEASSTETRGTKRTRDDEDDEDAEGGKDAGEPVPKKRIIITGRCAKIVAERRAAKKAMGKAAKC